MSGTAPSARGSCQGVSATVVASVRSCALANSGFFVSGQESLDPFVKRETHSTPAAMNTSPSPALIAWYAILVDCSDDEQYRLTVVPGTVSSPSMTAATRAILKPCSPPGSPQPTMRSSTWAGSTCGTLASTADTIWTSRSSGLMEINDPLNARPMGERAVATMTASGMPTPPGICACRLHVNRDLPHPDDPQQGNLRGNTRVKKANR